jgi:hypothetical protein
MESFELGMRVLLEMGMLFYLGVLIAKAFSRD